MSQDAERPAVDWTAVQHAYETGELTIKQICACFGISKGKFEYRCNKLGWVSRLATRAERQRSTLARLFNVLERQVSKLANAGGETLGDKEAQQLTELIKNFDKISSMAKQDGKAEAPPETREMREMRDTLAKRFEQLSKR